MNSGRDKAQIRNLIRLVVEDGIKTLMRKTMRASPTYKAFTFLARAASTTFGTAAGTC
jgi:hypothetical protein